MYNNPYLNNMNPFTGFQQFPQENKQPITQNFQLASPISNVNDFFMARFLKENQSVETEIVTQKTAFIDLNNKKLSIKDLDGSISSYEIVLPKDEKDLRIEQQDMQIATLQEQINLLKERMENAKSTTDVQKSTKK